MPDQNPESRPSASGLLTDLKKAFGDFKNTNWLNAKESVKPTVKPPARIEDVAVSAPALEQVPPVSASDENAAPDWLTPSAEETVSPVVLAQSSADTIAHPIAAPTVVGLHLSEAQATEPPGIPDWLSTQEAPKDSDLPTLVGAAPVPAVEIPVASAAPELTVTVEPPAVPIAPEPVKENVEVDPFAANKEFNGYMETIRQALETLASGTALNSDQEKQAKIAAAKANSLLPKLPPDVLQSVILMRAVASNNPKFSKNDFQREMLGVVKIIVAGPVKKG